MDNNAVISVYSSHTEAEQAIDKLRQSGFDVKKLSIVGKDYHTEEHVVGFYNTGERVDYWGKFGAFWGAIWGFLTGAALFFVPGVGPVVIAGPVLAWILAALEGALVVGGLSALGAALYSIGIPKDSVLLYEEEIKADKFVVVAHGTEEEVKKAQEVLSTSGALRTDVYDAVKHEAVNAQPAAAAAKA